MRPARRVARLAARPVVLPAAAPAVAALEAMASLLVERSTLLRLAARVVSPPTKSDGIHSTAVRAENTLAA